MKLHVYAGCMHAWTDNEQNQSLLKGEKEIMFGYKQNSDHICGDV